MAQQAGRIPAAPKGVRRSLEGLGFRLWILGLRVREAKVDPASKFPFLARLSLSFETPMTILINGGEFKVFRNLQCNMGARKITKSTHQGP